jgi:crotonobetainyl-CoA:carnitine CoA-transferase CaiB-like acyl-CoA transferase
MNEHLKSGKEMMTAGPLNKQLKVVELCSFVAGPYCTKLFADFDAEVIKIEQPGVGDEARRRGPFLHDNPDSELSGTFLYLNTNKLGITLDLETGAGRDIFKKLIAGADILVEDKAPGEMKRLGLDYDTLKKINPSLIMTAITPFGQTGPYRNYKSYHLTTYHASGQGYFLPMNSPNLDREPVRGPGFLGEYDGGLSAAIATLGALFWRDNGGTGQYIDVSKQHSMMHLERSQLRRFIDSGKSPNRTGMGRLLETLVKARDGNYVVLILSSELQWRGLFEAMGRPEWGLKEPFNTQAGRSAHFNQLQVLLQEWANQHTAEEIFHKVQGCKSACAPAYTAEQFFQSSQIEAHGYFLEIDHPVAGKLKYPGWPFQFSNLSWRTKQPAPLLGQHNEEVFCTHLGYTKQDLLKLKQAGVI